MRRALVLVLALAGLVLAAPAMGARGFSFGVAAGEVTSTSAHLWARATRPGRVLLQLSHSRGFHRVLVRGTLTARRPHDLTVQALVARLTPRARYFYRFCVPRHGGRACSGRRSATGTFVTAPAARSRATIRFGWSGDQDAQPKPGTQIPFYNTVGDRNFKVWKTMRAERNDFNIALGDTIYSDSEVGGTTVNGVFRGAPPALTLKQKWQKYRMNLALENFARIRGAAAFYSHPDDHEWINDFGPNETLTGTNARGRPFPINGRKLYPVGVGAFLDYAPVTWTQKSGFYRVFHWGRNLDVFFLDERSFRSAKAGSPYVHACDNPITGKPDLAPTGPPDKRALFAALTPALAAPVSQKCLATIRSPKRTFLGHRQLATFQRAIKRSKATWKVIMSEVPIHLEYALPYDFWEGYAYERNKLLHFLQRNVKNAVFLSADHHGNLAGPVRYSTFRSEGGPRDTGMTDIATGPVATRTYKREINDAVGQDQETGAAGPAIDSAFLTPPPDAGVGLRCSAIDVFSYGEVTVTAKRLTVRLKDLNGRPVREEEGTRPPCPTFRFSAR
jgi:alkaline phosphatase D